jgi:hypothetical protein
MADANAIGAGAGCHLAAVIMLAQTDDQRQQQAKHQQRPAYPPQPKLTGPAHGAQLTGPPPACQASAPWKKRRKIFQSLESQIRTPFQVCEFGDANVSLE